MRKLSILLVLAGVLAQAPARAADPAPVVAAERAFAARAAQVGVAPSFLEFMADDAIVFQPDVVSAKALYSGRPAPKPPKEGGTLLAWWPNFAGMARSGDLGFTTGPATVNGKPGVFYFTVWARQPDGGWKWVYDGGVDAGHAGAPGPEVAPIALPDGDRSPMPSATALHQVKAAETALAARAKTAVALAYGRVLAPDARIQGSTSPPATSPALVARELATRAKTIDFSALGGGSSSAGDLVWTYGDARWTGGRGHYVRIWQRRAGRWALVFDQIVGV